MRYVSIVFWLLLVFLRFFFLSFSASSCSPLNLCDTLKLTTTKLFVHANTIKWKARSYNRYLRMHWRAEWVCFRFFFLFFCFTSSLVDRLMTKLCWWKVCKHDTKTRDAPIFTARTLCVCVCVFLSFLFSSKDNQNWWTGNAVFIEVYAIRARHTTNLTTTKDEQKNTFIFICIKNERKKSKSKWFAAHTHIRNTDTNGHHHTDTHGHAHDHGHTE